MTKPTITPIGFMLPSRSFSTTSGLASSACCTIGSSVSSPPLAPRPSCSTIARVGCPRAAAPAAPPLPDARGGAPALGGEPVEDLLRRALRDRALGDHPHE